MWIAAEKYEDQVKAIPIPSLQKLKFSYGT